MYESLIAKINETLLEVPNVKDVFSVPKTKLTKFPAVFFKPAGLSNTFETNNSNLAIYRFLMIVMIGTNSSIKPSEAFQTVLPHTVDSIIDKFNEKWDMGTIDGHRITVKIDSADAWELSEEEDGIIAYAPMNIEIKLATSN